MYQVMTQHTYIMQPRLICDYTSSPPPSNVPTHTKVAALLVLIMGTWLIVLMLAHSNPKEAHLSSYHGRTF